MRWAPNERLGIDELPEPPLHLAHHAGFRAVGGLPVAGLVAVAVARARTVPVLGSGLGTGIGSAARARTVPRGMVRALVAVGAVLVGPVVVLVLLAPVRFAAAGTT